MGALAALIGIIPDYKTIGIYSICLLLSIRILQGIILGGDFSGNILYLCENSHKYKNVLGGIGSLSGSVGITIASFVSSLVYASKIDYLWRIAFIICFPIGIFFTFLRRNVKESQLRHKRPKVSNPLQHLIKNDLIFFFYGLGILTAQACSFYFLFFYTPSYINGLGELFSHASYLINTILLFLHILLIPFFGLIADKFNGKNLLFISFLIQLTLGLLVFSDQIQFSSIIFLMLLSVTTAINAATIPNFISNLLPIETRYTSFSLIYSIGFGIMGGSTPYFASKLGMISKNFPSIILVITGLLSLILISVKILEMKQHAQNSKGMTDEAV